MIKIRLSRLGKRNKPFYRIVAIDESKKREGEPREVLGFWNPVKKEFKINQEKLEDWLKKGAVLNQSVKNLLGK
ncbi:MAG: SSU ribosomal protein S16p [Candidatus Woesebacteria bacterium]|jgi:small subunit ribosomal protein S16|nr:MAG: SSU ribosomal protein S16p [Candidatus Woesebacteria bacterium]